MITKTRKLTKEEKEILQNLEKEAQVEQRAFENNSKQATKKRDESYQSSNKRATEKVRDLKLKYEMQKKKLDRKKQAELSRVEAGWKKALEALQIEHAQECLIEENQLRSDTALIEEIYQSVMSGYRENYKKFFEDNLARQQIIKQGAENVRNR